MNTLITVNNVSVTLRGTKALNYINFELEKGGHTALIGPNGSGKSTFLRLVRGEVWPNQQGGGEIYWHTPQGPDFSPLAGRAMCALFSSAQQQLYARQRHDISAGNLILAGLSDSHLLYTAPGSEARQKLEKVADELQIGHLLERRLPSLSHGQLRIVLLAKAIIRDPAVLLLDECAEGLDQNARKRMYEHLERMAPKTTIIFASHRQECLPFIERTVHLSGGAFTVAPCTSACSIANVYAKPVQPKVVDAQDGAEKEVFIAVRNATVYVERALILRNINWTIRRGEQWLLLGSNGAGKSTLLRLLAGYEYPAVGGCINRDLGAKGAEPDVEEIRRGIRLVSDLIETDYDYDLPIKEIVLSGFEGSVGLYRNFSEEEHKDAERAMRLMGIADLGGQRLSTMSTGLQRRVFLARALVGNPKMILLDEPFAGLDQSSAKALMHTIGELASGDNAVNFVLASHYEQDFPAVFTRSAVMERGLLLI